MSCIQMATNVLLELFCYTSTYLNIVDAIISQKTCALVDNYCNQDYFFEVLNHGIVITNSCLYNNTILKLNGIVTGSS